MKRHSLFLLFLMVSLLFLSCAAPAVPTEPPTTAPTTIPTTAPTAKPTDPPGTFALNRTECTLTTEGITLTLYAGSAPVEMVTFTSDDPDIATFTNGVVTAVGIGSTTVYAELNGEKLGCTVHCQWEEPTTAPTEPVYVHENAVEDFLLPLEEYSWERTYAPEFVMIHFTSAVTEHRKDPFNMEHIRKIFVDYDISIHYIIERDGTVRCYIPENRVAWHAGRGEWNNDPKYTNTMNQYAIGIEVVAIGSESDMAQYLTKSEYRKLDDAMKGFTQAQYDALELLVADLCQRYEIPMDRSHVIGHEDYSPQKADPGELFDWSQILPEA